MRIPRLIHQVFELARRSIHASQLSPAIPAPEQVEHSYEVLSEMSAMLWGGDGQGVPLCSCV